jgi:hypothetical protein
VNATFERPSVIDEDLSAFAVGLPARSGMEVYWLKGSVGIDVGNVVELVEPNA